MPDPYRVNQLPSESVRKQERLADLLHGVASAMRQSGVTAAEAAERMRLGLARGRAE